MPALFTQTHSAAQLTRVLASPRKLLLISSHTGRLTGNALGLVLAAQSSPDFLPVFLGKRAPLPLPIPTWTRGGRVARFLLKRADVIAYTGSHRAEYALGPPHMLRLLLWHGMPIKGIGAFDSFTHRTPDPCDLAIATSELTAEIMARSFRLAPERIVISGEPKTDYLPADRPGWDWTASLRLNYRRIIGYLPTWRGKIVEIDGRQQRRGDDEALGQLVSQLTGDAALRDLLARHRAAFVIRVHTKHAKTAPPLSPPFFSMDDGQGDATHLLQECDAIVGDYSSVVIDALLFDRPLALWCEDLERYTAERPLPYFDFRDTFGWALKTTLPQLRDWLAERLDSRPLDPSESEGFARCRALFHRHRRGGAGERVLEALRARLESRSSQ